MIGAAILWLTARGLSSLVAGLIVWGVIVAAVGGAVWFVAHQWDVHVGEPYRVEGDDRTKAVLLPQIAGLEKKVGETITERDNARADLKTALSANAKLLDRIDGKGGLVEQIATSKKSVERWRAIADQLRATNAAISRKLDAAIAAAQPAVDRARAIVSGPAAATFEESCREADRILGDLAKRMHAT